MAQRELSTKPQAARARMRRSGNKLDRDMKILADSRKPVEEWDMEELARGRPKDADGHFRGAPPKWITPIVLGEAKRRLGVESYRLLSGHITDAINVMHKLMMSTERDADGKPIVDARTRMQAAMFIIEQVMGKAKARVEVDTNDNTRTFLAGALKVVDNDGELVDAHPVVDLTSDEWSDDDDR